LPKGKAIFPFLGVLDDHPTMAQCEGFFVIGRLEVLQRFDNLHTDNGFMHKQNTSTRELEVIPCQPSRALYLPFLDLLERPLKLATLGMDGAPYLGKG
jgi:hypothetical protein